MIKHMSVGMIKHMSVGVIKHMSVGGGGGMSYSNHNSGMAKELPYSRELNEIWK